MTAADCICRRRARYLHPLSRRGIPMAAVEAFVVVAGDQPPSSMAPTVLKSKSKVLVIGGTGGSMITTGVASAIINNLWLGMSLREAIAAPVLYVDSENAVTFEGNFDKDVIEDLKSLGHIHKPIKKFFNVVNAVEKDGRCISAVSDARKMGKAVGY